MLAPLLAARAIDDQFDTGGSQRRFALTLGASKVLSKGGLRHGGRVRPELPSFVDFSTVTDAMNDDGALALQDLEDDSKRSFSNLVEALQFTFERVQFR